MGSIGRRVVALGVCLAAVGLVTSADGTVVATAQQVSQFLGGATGKLVYTKLDCNDQLCNKKGRSLWYVDLSQPTLTERMIVSTQADDAEPRNTVVSPDGQWISYNALNTENTSGGSWLYVCRLQESGSPVSLGNGALPHWWRKPATDELYLIYNNRDLEENNGWMMSFPWDRVATHNVRLNPTTMAVIGSSTQLLGYEANGGRSVNGEWLFAAGGAPGTYRINATTTSNATATESNSLSMVASTPGNDTLDGCNPSMSPHAAEADIRLMYVCRDNANNHTAYWLCGVRGANRTRVRWVSSENPYVDEPEWSNVAAFGAAKASAALTTAPFDVYIMKVGDGSNLKVLEGNYSFPYLWLDPASIGVRDSRRVAPAVGGRTIEVNGTSVKLPGSEGSVRVADLRGRTVAQWSTASAAQGQLRLAPGAYTAVLTSPDGHSTALPLVAR